MCWLIALVFSFFSVACSCFLPLPLIALISKEVFLYMLLFFVGYLKTLLEMRLRGKNTYRILFIFLLAKVMLNIENFGSCRHAKEKPKNKENHI